MNQTFALELFDSDRVDVTPGSNVIREDDQVDGFARLSHLTIMTGWGELHSSMSAVVKDAGVDAWFTGKPAEPALRRVRDVIMSADKRMAEYLKYGTIVFASGGDFASFVQHGKKTVSVMFHRGARIKGKFLHFEGSGPTARFMRFADVAEVNARAAELSKITVAWCDLTPKEKGYPVK
jgi:hypothetical protein